MNLLTQNSKLKRTSKELGLRVFNFGIPAYKSASGKLTCPMAKECVKFCYAKKGAYIWSNVQPAFEKRYQLSKTDSFISKMMDEIDKKKPDYVRVHDSGDYYSKKYLQKWIDIAIMNPKVKFYSYTNCVDMLKNVDQSEFTYQVVDQDGVKYLKFIVDGQENVSINDRDIETVRVTCEELELTLNLSVEDNFQPVRIHKINGKTEFTMLLIEFMS